MGKSDKDADVKAPAKDSTATQSKAKLVYNNGIRTITLKDGPNGAKRHLPPGASIEAIDDQEYQTLMRYRDVSDAEKTIPGVAGRIEALEKEKADLLAERDDLQKRIAELEKKGK